MEQDYDLTTERIIYFAFSTAVLVYGGVAYGFQTMSQKTMMEPGLVRIFALVFSFVSVSSLGAITLFPLETFIEGEGRSPEVIRKAWRTSKIVHGSLIEAVSVYGLVLAILSSNVLYYIPFAVVSLAGFALTFPGEAKLKQTIRRKSNKSE